MIWFQVTTSWSSYLLISFNAKQLKLFSILEFLGRQQMLQYLCFLDNFEGFLIGLNSLREFPDMNLEVFNGAKHVIVANLNVILDFAAPINVLLMLSHKCTLYIVHVKADLSGISAKSLKFFLKLFPFLLQSQFQFVNHNH